MQVLFVKKSAWEKTSFKSLGYVISAFFAWMSGFFARLRVFSPELFIHIFGILPEFSSPKIIYCPSCSWILSKTIIMISARIKIPNLTWMTTSALQSKGGRHLPIQSRLVPIESQDRCWFQALFEPAYGEKETEPIGKSRLSLKPNQPENHKSARDAPQSKNQPDLLSVGYSHSV